MSRESVVAADRVPVLGARPAESVRRRYAATLFAQGLQFALSMVSAFVVPRALGPAAYGNYNFLLNMSGYLRGVTEPSAQQTFFTFSSQEERSGALTRLYGIWVLVQFALLLSIVAIVALAGWTQKVWPGQQLDQIFLITVLDWMVFLSLALKQLGDSKGLTARPQLIGAVTAFVTAAAIVGLAVSHRLDFYSYAWLNLASAAITSVVVGRWLLVVHRESCWDGSIGDRARGYLQRWWAYARPLIVVEYLVPLVAPLASYLIQAFYGSYEQGQLALATRWSAVVLLFTSSAVMILWREIARATQSGDSRGAARTYERVTRPLVFLTIAGCLWISISAPSLVPLFAGAEYSAAVPVLMIMAFYPLVQTLGQLSTAGLKAAGRTIEFRNWALLMLIPDFILTYFFIAPPTARLPGLGWGAVGSALKLTGLGLLGVQLYQWDLCRSFGGSYRRLLKQQLFAAAVAVGCAAVALLCVRGVLESVVPLNALARLALSSALYAAGIVGIVAAFPEVVSSSKHELSSLLRSYVLRRP
jgi:O-antigen/teichoic acid export membrane protein